MTEDYQKQADAAEREVADMEERSERVGELIDETRKDWEAKVEDPPTHFQLFLTADATRVVACLGIDQR